MDNNNITVQAVLDTNQLRKDLEKFEGEISLTASTEQMVKQIENALKSASKNADISLKCTAPGLQEISNQVSSARLQIQSLQAGFRALPTTLNLNVSVDSSGLNQYQSQLERCLQLSNELNTISLQSAIPQIETSSTFNSTVKSTEITSSEQTASAGKSISNTLAKIPSIISTLNASFNLPSSYKNFSTTISKSFD